MRIKKNQKKFHYLRLTVIVALVFVILPKPASAYNIKTDFPKKANYFLGWSMTESQARELSKWDLVILDMEIQARSPQLLTKMRQWNPNINLLVYITPQEIIRDAADSSSIMRRRLAGGFDDAWYLKSSVGEKLSSWPGTYLLNITNSSPTKNGQRFNDYLINFVSEELLGSGYWDGVFYDNMWDSITYFAGNNIDLNVDGRSDSDLDSQWKVGMKYLYEETRSITNNKYIILGNGTTDEYLSELNGTMVENFFNGTWSNQMNTYEASLDKTLSPDTTLINANTGNKGNQTNYQEMRFGLGSALLEDGYYSYDYGDQDHNQLWWYDEYDISLGEAISEANSERGYTSYADDVWSRDFTNGLAVINSTNNIQTVSLGGEYEKLHGLQDASVNDGSIVSEVEIDSLDALLLFKTFASLNDAVFTNGSFIRFFGSDGKMVRNGFFAFEEGELGGIQIAHIDLDGNGARELLIATHNKITVWRDDGQIYMRKYPYTASYKGELRISVGDLNADGNLEIYVAPSQGYPAPIKIYTRHGRQMNHDWYPFGEKYNGGYTVAVVDVEGRYNNELIIGSGEGREPRVYVYDRFYKPINSFLAFESSFRGGINVASGDLDGSGTDEIVVGSGPGKGPLIRTFDMFGSIFASQFIAYTTFLKAGIEVMTADVDFDGNDDIIGMSEGL
ncbi:MAG: putative glycoside hydrolase [Patescibacteria group bacterium]